MKVYNFNMFLNESKEFKKFNDILKNLGVIDNDGNIDLNDMNEKIEQFLSKDDNKDKFLKNFDKNVKSKVTVEKVKIKTKKLKTSQKEIFLDHILSRLVVKDYEREQILNGELRDNDILISGDEHIIDGHHRWAMSFILNPKCDIVCTKIDLPIKYALPLINAILSVKNIENEDNVKYNINLFDVKDDSKMKLLKKMNSIIIDTIKNGVNIGNKKLKSEDGWNTNESLSGINTNIGKSFYKNIKHKMSLNKHPLKHMIKNMRKIKEPKNIFSEREDMPQIKEKDLKKIF